MAYTPIGWVDGSTPSLNAVNLNHMDQGIQAAVRADTVTTKGDLLVATGNAAVARVGVGADGTVPVADSTQTTGISWAHGPKPGTGQNPLTGWFHVDGYGADPTGAADSGPAINSAIADAKAVTGGVVYLPPGTYKISTTINLSNIHPLAYHYNSDPGVTLRGAGRHATILTGGEASYGIMELVGSNRITVEGMSIQPTTAGVQYAILGGRTTGDGSSGEHVFRDVIVYGSASLALIWMMSSEQCTYDRVLVYATAGKGVVLARENDATYNAVAKYTPLSTSTTIGGGNGQNHFKDVSILSLSQNSGDYPLTLEYVQTFTAQNLYIITSPSTGGPAAQVFMRKQCMGAKFDGLQQEYTGTRPLGFYFSANGASPSSPDYRGVAINSGRALSVYGENSCRLGEFEFIGTEWRGADTWQIDVDVMYDSTVKYDARLTSDATRVTNPQYRVRSTSAGNQWGPQDVASLGTPAITLGTTSSSGGTFAAGTYYWVVTATNSYGQSIASNEVTATLAANGTQVLNWSTTNGATGYKVYRSTTSGSYTGSCRVALLGNVLTYTDTGGSLAAEAPPTVATAGLPSAAYRGKGAMLYNTTINKPIWSTGSAWQDAAGNVVT